MQGFRVSSVVAMSPPSSRRGALKARRFGVALSVLAGAVGCFWLGMWLYGSPESQALASDNCKTNTSFSLVLLSLAYALLSTAPSPRRRLAASVALSIAGGIGGLTILEYAAGVDLGIDELLVRDISPPESALYPNRMSPSAALCFVLLSSCPGLITRRNRLAEALGQACAVVTLGVCSIALIGYLYSASILYQPLPFLRLSPYTACADLLLVAAAFSLRPDVGLGRAITSTSIGGYLARRLLPITLLLPVVVGWLLLDSGHHSLLAPAESHAFLATAVALVMAPTVLFLALSLDRLERDRLEAEEFLRSTAELTSALARARSVEDVVEATLDLGLPALGARAGGFFRMSDDGRELLGVATRGYPEPIPRDYQAIAVDADLPLSRAVRNREPIFLGTSAQRDREFPALERYKDHDAWAALPLEGSRGVLGAVGLSFAAGQRFHKTTRSRARQLAWQCAQALDRALLFDSEQLARQRAEAASRAKDEFLAMLGHELRNPLSPILTSLHLMELRDPRSSVKERDVIKRQVSHMVRLVDDLLDVSRIASGRVELKKHVVELSTIVGAALELSMPLFEQRQHQVVVDVPDHGLAVDVTAAGWFKSSPTCSRTPPSTRASAGGWSFGQRAAATKWSFESPTTAWASPLSSWATCSICSFRAPARWTGPREVWGWACPWSRAWWSCTAAPRPRRARDRDGAASSPSCSRSSPRPSSTRARARRRPRLSAAPRSGSCS